MAIYGSGYDSLAQQRQFYDNLAMRAAELNRASQQQGYENQLAQQRADAAARESYLSAQDRRDYRGDQLDLQRQQALASMLLRKEQLGNERERIAATLMGQKQKAALEMPEMQYKLAQDYISGATGAGQEVDPEELPKLFPLLTPEMRASIGKIAGESNTISRSNQQSVLAATALLNQISNARSALSSMEATDLSKGDKEARAMTAKIGALRGDIKKLEDQAKGLGKDIRASIQLDPQTGAYVPAVPISRAAADSVEQNRQVGLMQANQLRRLIESMSGIEPGTPEYANRLLPNIIREQLARSANQSPMTIPFLVDQRRAQPQQPSAQPQIPTGKYVTVRDRRTGITRDVWSESLKQNFDPNRFEILSMGN